MNKYLLRFKCYFKETGLGIFYRRRRDLKQFNSPTQAKAVISVFEPNASEEETENLLKDMMEMAQKYHFGYDEYFLYEFKNKSLKERLAYVSDYERIAICEKLNNAKNQYIFDDKAETYQHFKKFYKRELIPVYSGTKKEIENLRSFINRHPVFVIKPIDSSCGENVEVLDSRQAESLDIFITQLLKKHKDSFIVEEFIVQDAKMASLHPKSVNTMRISTIRMDDRVIILYPRLRIGQKGNFVDNASAGGLLCVVDLEKGIVISSGDKNGNRCAVHPDTGTPIIGFEVPQWDELISIVQQLAQVVPENRYTGWDMALGTNGWAMVEGNARAQFGWQYSLQKGFSDEIDSIFNELHLSR